MAYSTIPKGSLYMNTKTYTGNGGTNAVTGVGFQPDWVWFKSRSNPDDHNLFDAIRGVTKCIETNTTVAEFTQSNGLTAFGTDGFTVGDFNAGNRNGGNIVAWNWKAGTAFSNNAGANGATLASTGSVNDTAGFSIVSYTGNTTAGATIKHGLSTKPDVIICKARQDSGGAIEWTMYHKGIPTPQNNTLCLNTNAAKVDRTIAWNDTAPTSSVFSVGTWVSTNAQVPMIAYAFTEKTGYSKFGSYTGNGNADGTFIYTGFKPAFFMIKRTNGTGNWKMVDSKRLGYNPDNNDLYADLSNAEDTADYGDIVSNGFKWRSNEATYNGSGDTFIYMAFASNPFVATSGSDAIPVTAR